jgi:hypothetical protein
VDLVDPDSDPDPQHCIQLLKLPHFWKVAVTKAIWQRCESGSGTHYKEVAALLRAALWNRNYFLRFRFRLLKSYGSGSNFGKVMVPVPVPTFEKLWFQFRFRFQLHI